MVSLSKRNKIILGAMVAVVLIGIIAIIATSGGGAVFGRMTITAPTDIRIVMTYQVQNNQVVPTAESRMRDIVVRVEGAPSSVGSGVDIYVHDTNVVAVHQSWRSGNATTIRIAAQGVGVTYIRATTHGGGREVNIRVQVDVPAQSFVPVGLEDARFGVMINPTGDTEFEFTDDDFHFFPTALPLLDVATSWNELDFSIVSNNTRGTRIEDNRLILPYLEVDSGVIMIQATLRRNQSVHHTFPMYIFDDFGPLGITDMAGGPTSNSGTVIASLIKNDTTVGPDFVNYLMSVGGADLHVNRSLPGGGTLTFGYEAEEEDDTVAWVSDRFSSNFRIDTAGRNETYVRVIAYPILQLGGQTILFNRPQDHRVQLTRDIRVEVRNVFTDDLKIVDNEGDELNAVYAFLSQERQDRFYFGLAMDGDDVFINNTRTHNLNDRVTFNLVNSPVTGWAMHEIFDIRFSNSVLGSTNIGTTMTQTHFANGVQYWQYFSISIVQDPRPMFADIVDQLMGATTLQFEVRSRETRFCTTLGVDVPLASVIVPLRIVRSVTEIGIENAGAAQIDSLFPVRATVPGPFTFYVTTNLGNQAVLSHFRWNLSHDDLFIVTPENVFQGQRLRVTIQVNPLNAHEIQLGTQYLLRIGYVSGYYIDVPIIVLERLESLSFDITPSSGGQIFGQTPRIPSVAIPSGIQSLFVQVDGIYQLNLRPHPVHASVFASMTVQSGNAANIQFDTTNFTFRPIAEGSFTIRIHFHSVNPDVLSGFVQFIDFDVVVLNPLMSVNFIPNQSTIYSINTLSHFETAMPEDSFFDFTLDLRFARGAASASTINISYNYDSPNIRVEQLGGASSRNFRVHGLHASNGFETIFFTISQTFMGQHRSFTFNDPLQFRIQVLDAPLIQTIHATNVGDTLNVSLTQAGQATFDVTVRHYPEFTQVHDARIGFAFEVGGTIFNPNGTLRTFIENPLIGFGQPANIAAVAQNGRLTAWRSNVGNYEHDIRLVMFTFDSIRRDSGNALLQPTTQIAADLYIFDPRPATQQFFIETLDQFLNVFNFERATGAPNSGNESIQVIGAQRFQYFVRPATAPAIVNGYFRIAADIDFSQIPTGANFPVRPEDIGQNFSGVILQPIAQFSGTLDGSRSYAVVGGDREAKFQLQNMSIMTRTNWTPWRTDLGTIENIGLFGMITSVGRVQGISFTGVQMHVNFNRIGNTALQSRDINFGVLAGINHGFVRDVSVNFAMANYTATGYEALNFGSVVGTNNGTIQEENFMRTSGVVTIWHGADQPAGTIGRRAYNINFGGVAGLNMAGATVRGHMDNLAAGGILQDNQTINSEVVLVLATVTDIVDSTINRRNVGGIVGENLGTVREVSSQSVIFSAGRGNSGGLIGRNTGTLENSFATSAVYARGAMGGLVGWSSGTISNSYFDMYINQTVRDNLDAILRTHVPPTIRAINPHWGSFYAGLIVGIDANTGVLNANPTYVGGVVGINDGGDILNSFASSIFTHHTTSVLGLDFRGDIYIHGASGVTVGGVLGLQTGVGSQISGVYSNLLVNYNAGNDLNHQRRAPIMGGVIGRLAPTTNATIVAAYSVNHYRLNAHAQDFNTVGLSPALSVGGMVGRSDLSNPATVEFFISYTVLPNSRVEWVGGNVDWTRINTRLGHGTVPLTLNNVSDNEADMRTRDFNTSPWIQGGHNANSFFINWSNHNPIYTGMAVGNQLLFATQMNFDFPMIRTSFNSAQTTLFNLPLIIAQPNQITLSLRTQAVYSAMFGAERNNRGGFNYVILPDTPSVPATAALMFTGDGINPGSRIVANRYYLDDLFTMSVSPAIASRRMHIAISNRAIATEGRSVENGEIRYFIQLTGVMGTFEITATSTRHEEGQEVVGRVRFDVVPGITTQTVTRDAVALHGHRSLLTGDINNRAINFSVQRGTTVSLRGAVTPNNTAWGIVSRFSHASNIGGTEFANGTPMPLPEAIAGGVNFHFVPRIEVGGRVYTMTDSLEITINVEVYDGAIQLDLKVYEGIISGTNAAVFSGVMVTDIRPAAFNSMNLTTLTPAQRITLMTGIANFAFHEIEGGEIVNRPNLFTTGNRTRIHITEGGRSFFLVFELFVEPIIALPGAYFEFRFNINLSIEVDTSVYIDIPESIFENPSAMPLGVFGTINVFERNLDNRSHSRLIEPASAYLTVLPQELYDTTIRHHTSTAVITRPDGSHGIELLDWQTQNWTVFTDSDPTGAILMVQAHPFFSNIDSFTISSSMVQWQGEYWAIEFDQLVLDVTDPSNQIFVNMPIREGDEFLQISTRRTLPNGSFVYSWDGTFYIRTRLVAVDHVPTLPLEQGRRFNITTRLESINGVVIQNTFTLYSADRPGLVFNYNGEYTNHSVQAVGTTHHFTVSTNGDIDVNWNVLDINIMPAIYGPHMILTRTGDRSYSVQFLPTMPIGARVSIQFTGTMFDESTGAQICLTTLPSSTLTLDAMLFRVDGFRIEGVLGDTIRLRNNNRQSMRLSAIVDRYNGHTNNSALTTLINNGIIEFEHHINVTEDLLWTGWDDNGRGWLLNRSPLVDEFYRSAVGPGGADTGLLYFYLGRGAGANDSKFVTAATLDSRHQTLDVRMNFSTLIGRYVVQPGGDVQSLTTRFWIETVHQSTEYNPSIIRTEQDFINMLTIPANAVPNRMDRHFILMDDIVLGAGALGPWVPRVFNVGSLDGNNHRITIARIAVPAATGGTVNIGMFSEIGVRSVVRNLNIIPGTQADVSTLSINLSVLPSNVVVNLGVLAGVNHGIVTNVAVLPNQQFIDQGGRLIANFGTASAPVSAFDTANHRARARLQVIMRNPQMQLRVGGSVGLNSTTGVISNSRVLVDIHTNLAAAEGATDFNATRTAYVAGFVGENNGYIVSSFFREANIHNNVSFTPGPDNFNRTAGFVGRNTNIIRGSYVQGATNFITLPDTIGIHSESPIAGFVFLNDNNGVIENAFVNIVLGMGSFRAGFVYINSSGATIRNSFVHNTVHTGAVGSFHAFIFQANFNQGNLENNKVAGPNVGFITDNDQRVQHVNPTNIANLAGFSITSIEEANPARISPNIWQMFAIGPRLVSANHIAVSIRVESPLDPWIIDGRQVPRIDPVPGFEIGSRNNPTVVWSGDQFNSHLFRYSGAERQERDFAEHGNAIDWSQNIYEGYLRLVNNISLLTDELDGLHSHGGRLRTHGIIFSGDFDGNGLSINDISMNATDDIIIHDLRSVGLFSKIENGNIKNLNFNFRKHPGADYRDSIIATGASYVGGLAGVAINSNMVDLDLRIQTQAGGGGFTASQNMQMTRVTGENIVGGLVGIAVMFDHTGNRGNAYRIENVTSDLQVVSLFNQRRSYDFTNNYNQMGVAGGIIGIVTHDVRELARGTLQTRNDAISFMRNRFNNALLPQNQVFPLGTVGNVMSTHQSVRNIRNAPNRAMAVQGEVVGGLIGKVGSGINTVGLSYEFTAPIIIQYNFLRGAYYVGGLVGLNMGTVNNSQFNIPQMNVQSVENTNYIFDFHGHLIGMTVGGIAGFNSGIIREAINSTNMSVNFAENLGTNPIIHEVAWNKVMAVGGIAGENVGNHNMAINPATFWGGRIYSSEVLQPVAGGFILGGLVGIRRAGGVIPTGIAVNSNYLATVARTSTTNTLFTINNPSTIIDPHFTNHHANFGISSPNNNRTLFIGPYFGRTV